MKFIYMILFIVALVFDLVIFFQNNQVNQKFELFTSFISYSSFMIYAIGTAFLGGFFLALAIKGFLSGSKDIDDGFDL